MNFRWTVKAETLGSIIKNYSYLISLWEELLEGQQVDGDTRSRVLGLKSGMERFEFLFGRL